jgi:hypothetical protein
LSRDHFEDARGMVNNFRFGNSLLIGLRDTTEVNASARPRGVRTGSDASVPARAIRFARWRRDCGSSGGHCDRRTQVVV